MDWNMILKMSVSVLLPAHMTMGTKGEMKLLHVNEEVMDTLKITGMADVLNVVKD